MRRKLAILAFVLLCVTQLDAQVVINPSPGGGGGGMTAGSTDTLTNKTLNAESAGNVITITLPYVFEAAYCQGSTAITTFSLPTTNPAVPACVIGTTSIFGVLQFPDGVNVISLQGHLGLPVGPSSAFSTGDIEVYGRWRTSATTGNVKWQMNAGCIVSAATGGANPNLGGAATASATVNANGTANGTGQFQMTLFSFGGNCGDGMMFYKLFRDPTDAADTVAATAELINVSFVVRRQM